MPAILPGVKPTERKVVISFVVVVGFDKDEKVEFERIYWDQRACSDRADRQGWSTDNQRRAGCAFARSEPALEHTHSDRQLLSRVKRRVTA